MTEDCGNVSPAVRDKSDEELEVEAATPDHLTGNAQKRAIAKVEIQRRERDAANALADKQLRIAGRAVWAAWGGAVATFLAALATFVQALK